MKENAVCFDYSISVSRKDCLSVSINSNYMDVDVGLFKKAPLLSSLDIKALE